uniref:Uncharacterized protein n=1 Tax=Rhizophora mucronata TaxID=61149 RepID=A0A2P2PAZ6_RHIMU
MNIEPPGLMIFDVQCRLIFNISFIQEEVIHLPHNERG